MVGLEAVVSDLARLGCGMMIAKQRKKRKIKPAEVMSVCWISRRRRVGFES
jgi:hypothetical protein